MAKNVPKNRPFFYVAAGLFLAATVFIINPKNNFFHLLIGASVDTSNYKTANFLSVPLTDPEIINPMRGLYKWRGMEMITAAAPAKDAYQRYNWSDLEPTKDQYTFTQIDADMAKAASEGRKFAFRVRDLIDPAAGPAAVPNYIVTEGLAWQYGTTYIPDWQNPAYQARAQKLIAALGTKYGRDPRIAWMDIGMFGQYGEWYIGAIDYTKAPSGYNIPDEAAQRTVVDAYVRAFPDTQLVMTGKTGSPNVTAYALNHAGMRVPMGWRADCLGKPGYFDLKTNTKYAAAWAAMQDRWKTAPVVTELCASGVDPTTALSQIKEFHVSLVGNGNFTGWSTMSETTKAGYLTAGKSAGYRLELKNILYPAQIAPGQEFLFSSTWVNSGTAPTYEPWQVVYQFQNTQTGAIVWEGNSSVNLKTIVDATPQTVSDTFTAPATIPVGNYLLRIKVLDTRNQRAPMKLAMNAPQAQDGAHILIPITIAATMPSTSPVVSPVASATPPASSVPGVTPTPVPTNNPSPSPVSSPTTLNSAPTVDTGKLAGGRAGQAYSATIEGRDSDINDTLTMSATALPNGLSLSNCSQSINRGKKLIGCSLSGTTTETGSFSIQFKVTDQAGAYGDRTLKLDIR